MTTSTITAAIDSFVPDPEVAREFGISMMCIWRWDRNPAQKALGWPPKIKISERNYRSRNQLEQFKAALLKRALERGADAV